MYNVIKVLEGETLNEIAERFQTSVENLQAINNLDSVELRNGQEIIVPETSKQYFEYYTVKKGDSIYEIARRYNINPELLASLNGLNYSDYIYPDQVILIPKANYSYYVTKAGDTIDSVSNIFGVTRERLLKENNIVYLLEGQLLVKEK